MSTRRTGVLSFPYTHTAMCHTQVEPPINRHKEMGSNKYAFNFLAEDVENKLKREGVKTDEFKHPGLGSSNWFMPLTYHGEGECEQHGPSVAAGGKGKK